METARCQLFCKGQKAMFRQGKFDIFREFADGSIAWIFSVPALPDAKSHMVVMAWQTPGKYFVWSGGRRVAHVDTTQDAAKSLN